MEDLARNNRSLLTAMLIMIAVGAVIVGFGMILFPLTLYTDPNAGLIPGLFNKPGANVLVFGLFGLLAADIGVFLNTVIRLERERTAILERSAAQREAPSLPPPPQGALKSGDQ